MMQEYLQTNMFHANILKKNMMLCLSPWTDVMDAKITMLSSKNA